MKPFGSETSLAFVDDRARALAVVFARQYSPMVRLAGFMLADSAGAEEIVQEAFARLYAHLNDLIDPERADAYLRKIVVNLCHNSWRKKSVGNRPSGRIQTFVDDGSTERSERAEIVAALARLPRRQRQCLALRYYLDLSESETAATLGVSVGSVKTHTARGLASLREQLGGSNES